MSEPMIILCDIDNTILNTEQAVVEMYNRTHDDKVRLNDIVSWNYFSDKVEPDFFEFLTKPYTWLNDVQPIQSVCDLIKEFVSCPDYFTVYLVTASNPLKPALREKLMLAQSVTGVDKYHIITCNDKHLLHGDIMIDDYVKNIDDTPCPLAYLVDRPWNRDNYSSAWKRIPEFIVQDLVDGKDDGYQKGELAWINYTGDIVDVEERRKHHLDVDDYNYTRVHRLIP